MTVKKLYRELLRVAESDLRTATSLLDKGFFTHSLFYLSQTFEKANKSFLALIKTEYLDQQETSIEEYFTKTIGHDKKKATSEIIRFYRQKDSKFDFEKVNEKLMKSVKHYRHFESIKDFQRAVNEDFARWTDLRSRPREESDLLHQNYYHSNLCKYQMLFA